jgi:flagellar L-ring protein precursor FlgH
MPPNRLLRKDHANLLVLLFFVWATLVGCASSTTTRNTAIGGVTEPSASQAVRMHRSGDGFEASQGSLWVEHGGLSEMFINQKARRIGDIVTIKIVETASASNQASTNTDRKNDLSIGLTSFFGLENRYDTTSSFFNPFSSLTSGYNSEFEGAGATKRSGALEAFITARIVQQLPNGNMIIEGNREVRVNNENQIITLTGMVRSRDISSENIILSTYIADARISYSGNGVVNDRQKPGWLARLLDVIWPF